MDITDLYTLPWKHILVAAVVLFVIVGIWVAVLQRWNPALGAMDTPDATAYLRGSCGDAMEISLRFKDGRVVDAKYWTDGCRFSNDCGAAAAELALNKTPEEIADIDYQAIVDHVGGLPEEDWHCATLAAGTLQESLKTYLVGGSVSKEPGSGRSI
jgi:nitrogen fixation NifU-like protein